MNKNIFIINSLGSWKQPHPSHPPHKHWRWSRPRRSESHPPWSYQQISRTHYGGYRTCPYQCQL